MKIVSVVYFIPKIFTSTTVSKYSIYHDAHSDIQVSDIEQNCVTSYVGPMGRYISWKKKKKRKKTNKFLGKKMICFCKIDVNSFSLGFIK